MSKCVAISLTLGIVAFSSAGVGHTAPNGQTWSVQAQGANAEFGVGGFLAVPLGYPVAEWSLVNLDDDLTWELATLIAGTPARVGVYDPETASWIDGPHELAVEPKKWVVCDLDDDGITNYIYSVGVSILSREFPSEAPDTLGFVSVYPRGLVCWGADSLGNKQIGIADLRWGGAHYMSYLLHVYRVDTWDSSFTVEAGPAFPSVTGRIIESERLRFVHDYWITMTDFGGHNLFWQQKFRWVNLNGTVEKTLALPVDLTQFTGNGLFDTWSLLAADTILSSGPESPIVCWMLGTNAYGTTNDFWTVWGCYADTSHRPLWQISDSFVERYFDIVAYDLLDDPGSELIVPRKSDGTWEIRRAVDGEILETRPNMPMADLTSECLTKPNVEDLFYLDESTLYVYRADIVSGVFDDPEATQIPIPAVTITAHPNPFNAAVSLAWTSGTAATSLSIHNILGQTVRTFDESALSGSSTITWDGLDGRGRPVASGVYFARLATKDQVATAKLVLLR